MDAIEAPAEWTGEERRKVARAIAEHRLSRVDLYVWQELDLRGRSVRELAVELMLTGAEVERRAGQARELVRSALDRPSQEAYLGRWLGT